MIRTFTLLFLFFAMNAMATTYYVNGSNAYQYPSMGAIIVNGQASLIVPNNPVAIPPTLPGNGSDANPGTLAAPFRTIGKAVSVMAANDTTAVFPGIYAEYLTNSTPFTTLVATGGVVRSGGFVINTNNITIDGKSLWCFTGTNCPIAVGGVILCKEGACNITLKNFTAYQPRAPNGTLASWPLSVYTFCATNQTANLTNIWIENITFTNQGYIALGVNGDHITVTNCFWSGTNGFDAIQMACNNSDFVGLTFTNFDNPGNNSVHCDLIQGFTTGGYYCTNNVIRQCFAVDSQNNVKIGNFSNSSDNTLMTNIWFLNNIWIRVQELRDTAAPGVHSINETFFYCGQTGAHPLSYTVVNDATHGDSRGTLVYNDLFYGCGLQANSGNNGVNGWYQMPTNGQAGTVSGTSAGGNRMDYNWGISTNNGTKRIYPSLASGWGYTNDTGKTEAHGLNGGDPKFNTTVSYSNIWLGLGLVSASELKPNAGSAGRGAGTNLTGLVRGIELDYFGNARPSTNWTIGAIEP